MLLLKEFDLELNKKKYNIKVPMEVSEKVYSPSVPADNGVNEMRYQVAKIYTALNIEVDYKTCFIVSYLSRQSNTRKKKSF